MAKAPTKTSGQLHDTWCALRRNGGKCAGPPARQQQKPGADRPVKAGKPQIRTRPGWGWLYRPNFPSRRRPSRWCPVFEVRDTPPHPSYELRKPKGTSYLSLVPPFDLKFLTRSPQPVQEFQIGGTRPVHFASGLPLSESSVPRPVLVFSPVSTEGVVMASLSEGGRGFPTGTLSAGRGAEFQGPLMILLGCSDRLVGNITPGLIVLQEFQNRAFGGMEPLHQRANLLAVDLFLDRGPPPSPFPRLVAQLHECRALRRRRLCPCRAGGQRPARP